jgi:hypothetical protein
LLRGHIRNLCEIFSSPTVISEGDIQISTILQLIRSIYYCFAAEPADSTMENLYKTASSILGCIAIHRYCKIVLEQTVTDLLNMMSTASVFRQLLTMKLQKMLSTWCKYCTRILPIAFKVSLITLLTPNLTFRTGGRLFACSRPLPIN